MSCGVRLLAPENLSSSRSNQGIAAHPIGVSSDQIAIETRPCSVKGCDEYRLPYNRMCRDHYNEYMRDYVLRRYHRRRARYVEEWGGECVDCGSTKNLQFDHADASSKRIDVGKMMAGWSDKKVRAELNKCVLRCQPCHVRKSHAFGDVKYVEHGGGASGKKNCPCDLCRTKKREYMKAYNIEYKARRKELREAA